MASGLVLNEMVKRYAKGKGESIDVLAKAFNMSAAGVRYNLKKRGEYVEANVEPPVTDTASDKDLGIGEEDTSAQDLAALLANPALAKLIDAAVAARVAQLSTPSPENAQTSAFEALAKSLGHMIEVNAMQQPGYIKPLPADEVDRRAAGRIEMFALLEKYQNDNTPPLWTVGELGFVECTNMQEFAEGDKIRTYLPPVEDFMPENIQAEKVHEAMMRWLGGSTPEIGEQLRQAHLNSKLPPIVTGAMQVAAKPSLVEKVQSQEPATKTVSQKRRTMGSIVPERREITAEDRMSGAVGPAFTDAA